MPAVSNVAKLCCKDKGKAGYLDIGYPCSGFRKLYYGTS